MPMKKRRYLPVMAALLAVLLLPATAEHAFAESAKRTPAAAPLIAVIPPDAPPTYYQDKQTGKAAGFAVDVMDEIAQRAGLSITYAYEDGWSDIISMLKSGAADVAPGMGISTEREKGLAFTAPIDVFPMEFFVRSESAGIDVSSGIQTIGAVREALLRNC